MFLALHKSINRQAARRQPSACRKRITSKMDFRIPLMCETFRLRNECRTIPWNRPIRESIKNDDLTSQPSSTWEHLRSPNFPESQREPERTLSTVPHQPGSLPLVQPTICHRPSTKQAARSSKVITALPMSLRSPPEIKSPGNTVLKVDNS